jgi:hypothetical protein
MRWGQLFLAGIALCFSSSFALAGIVINSANFTATSPDRTQRSTPTTFPLISTSLNVTGPNGYSNNSINWFLNGPQTVLSFDMQHGQTSSEQLAGFKSMQVYFTATSDDPFAISGYYDVTQLGSHGGGGETKVALYEETLPYFVPLFENTQLTTFLPGSMHFAIPGSVGIRPLLNGSPTGNLVAGHSYVLIFDFNIEATSTISSPSNAVGNLTLTIGNVPEPTSAALVAFAAMIFGMQRSRNRSI